MEPEIVYRFVGDGARLIYGVPARDLTRADLDALPAHLRDAVAASDLYEAVAEED